MCVSSLSLVGIIVWSYSPGIARNWMWFDFYPCSSFVGIVLKWIVWIIEMLFPPDDRDRVDQSKQTSMFGLLSLQSIRCCFLGGFVYCRICSLLPAMSSAKAEFPTRGTCLVFGTSWLLWLLLEELSQHIISMRWVRLPFGHREHDAECSQHQPCCLNELFSLQFIKSRQGSSQVSHFGAYWSTSLDLQPCTWGVRCLWPGLNYPHA